MKEFPVLGMVILVVVLSAGVLLMEQYTATQRDMPSLSLYAFYFLCMKEGAAQEAAGVCRRELVDGATSVPLPDVVRNLRPGTRLRDNVQEDNTPENMLENLQEAVPGSSLRSSSTMPTTTITATNTTTITTTNTTTITNMLIPAIREKASENKQ